MLQEVLPGVYKLVHRKHFSASIIYLAIESCGKTHTVCDLQHIFDFEVTDFSITVEGAEQWNIQPVLSTDQARQIMIWPVPGE